MLNFLPSSIILVGSGSEENIPDPTESGSATLLSIDFHNCKCHLINFYHE